MLFPPPFALEHCTVRFLTPDEGLSVQALFERCADYAELYTGLPVGMADAQSFYIQIPENKTYDDQLLLGFYLSDSDAPIGVLGAVRDYPTAGIWYIGLLLLQPDQRGQDLGKQIYRAFENWAATQGAHAIRLGVVEQNPDALRFWTRLGFAPLETFTSTVLDYKPNVITILERSATPAVNN